MVGNKLSQLGAFLLLTALLSAWVGPSSPGTGGTEAGTIWTKRTSGTKNHLVDVTYGNGIFVAVGLNGTILTSRDGVKWTKRVSGTKSDLGGVTYGNGTFVAVGEDGTILTSP